MTIVHSTEKLILPNAYDILTHATDELQQQLEADADTLVVSLPNLPELARVVVGTQKKVPLVSTRRFERSA